MLNLFQHLFIRCKDVKRQRCEAVIKNKFCCNFTKTAINENSPCPPVFCSSDLTHPFTSPPLKGGESETSTLPSPIGEGATLPHNYNFNLKCTYRPNVLSSCRLKNKFSSPFTLHPSPKKRIAFTLAEGATHVAHFHNIRRVAFTLAEVLITLGIIGVVAAMTIPTLIHKFQNKALETQYKKAVSIVSQVILKAKADYGLDKFAEYCTYYPYENGSGKPYDHAEECYQILFESLLNVQGQKNPYTKNEKFINRHNDTIRTYNNKQTVTDSDLAGIGYTVFTTYVMPDGSYINFNIVELRLYIGIDTNGAKKPNKLGHDIFIFNVDKNNDALSFYTTKPQNLTDEELENYEEGLNKERAGNPCNLTSSQKGNGIGCSYYALRNECPYDSSKRYFECLP